MRRCLIFLGLADAKGAKPEPFLQILATMLLVLGPISMISGGLTGQAFAVGLGSMAVGAGLLAFAGYRKRKATAAAPEKADK